MLKSYVYLIAFFIVSETGDCTVPCPGGMSSVSGFYPCNLCPAGTYSEAFSDKCTPCSTNTNSAVGARICTPVVCSANSRINGNSDCECNDGHTGDASVTMIRCGGTCGCQGWSPAPVGVNINPITDGAGSYPATPQSCWWIIGGIQATVTFKTFELEGSGDMVVVDR